MATIGSTASGNWSSTSTWAGGVVPGTGDVANANHTVTIDQDITVQGLNGNGGQFQVAAARTITLTGAGITCASDFTAAVQLMSGSHNVTINGNITGGSSSTARRGVDFNSGYSGQLTIVGKVEGGSASFSVAVNWSSSTGWVDHTGDVIGGSGSDSYAFNISGASQRLTMRGGTLRRSSVGSSVAAIQHTAGVVRMDMIIDVGRWPFVGDQPRQLIVGGTSHQLTGPGDSAWPSNSGTYIIVPTVGGGGAPVPTSGVIWPNGVNA